MNKVLFIGGIYHKHYLFCSKLIDRVHLHNMRHDSHSFNNLEYIQQITLLHLEICKNCQKSHFYDLNWLEFQIDNTIEINVPVYVFSGFDKLDFTDLVADTTEQRRLLSIQTVN